jgi:DNA-binding transcriptional LysR family regulator
MKQPPSPRPAPSGLPAIDSRRLQAFVFAAEAQSFAAAAQSLNLVPSAVSHAIKSLEEDLSCVLFRRRGPKVSLTRAGLRLMPFARSILVQMDDMRREITLIDAQKDCLRVIVPDVFCARLLPTVLPDLQESFPAAALQIMVSQDPAECAESLRSSRADLAIAPADAMTDDLVRRDLFGEAMAFYAAPFHPFAKASVLTRDELRSATVMTADAGVHEFVASQFFLGQFLAARLWLLQSHESVCELASAGWGVAAIPEWVARPHVAGNRIVSLPVRGPRFERVWSAFWLGNTHPSWTADVFLSLVESAGQVTE